MRKLFAFIVIIIAAAFALAGATAEAEGELFESRPWLADASSLGQAFDFDEGTPPRTRRGALGVGNGHAFALIGLDIPQNTLSNLIGPDYETGEKWFGPVSHQLEVSGEPRSVSNSRLYRARRSNFAIVEEVCDGLIMRTVTFAPPGEPMILRLIEVENVSGATARDVWLAVSAQAGASGEAADESDGSVLRLVNTGRAMSVGFSDGEGSVAGETIRRRLGDLPSGGRATATLVVAFSVADAPAPSLLVEAPESLLDAARDEWAAWLDGALSVSSSDARLADFFENTLALLKSQRSAVNGSVAVMSRYSGAWCRDAYSPIRYFLLSGKFEEARAVASFYDYATRMVGFRNRYPTNLDLTKAPEDFDWESREPQKGDDPNILILHIYNVWRAGAADNDYIRRRYGFMRRNLTSQFDDACRLPFHGDETYQVYVMMQSGAPMSDFFSVDTNFWHVAAAEAMADMAAALGFGDDAEAFAARAALCRKMTDAHYWNEEEGYYTPYVKKDALTPADSPFGDINLNALWMGYGDAATPALRRNAVTTAKKLMNKRGGMKTSSRVSTYTGMLPGYLLHNLKAVGLNEQADLAFESLFNSSMSATGEFGEAYGANNRWLDYTAYPNVLRPWETAINAEAVLYYITGLKYDHKANRATLAPRLPPGVDFIEFNNLFAGPNRGKVSISRVDADSFDIETNFIGETGFVIEIVPTGGE